MWPKCVVSKACRSFGGIVIRHVVILPISVCFGWTFTGTHFADCTYMLVAYFNFIFFSKVLYTVLICILFGFCHFDRRIEYSSCQVLRAY